MTPLTRRTLENARAKVSHGWCKGAMCITGAGTGVVSTSKGGPALVLHRDGPTTKCFCAVGAVARASEEESSIYMQPKIYALARKALNPFINKTPGGLIQFNDMASTTHEDVLKMFDDALAA